MAPFKYGMTLDCLPFLETMCQQILKIPNPQQIQNVEVVPVRSGFQEVVAGVVWVYSAYLDYRTRPLVIKVFGLMDKHAGLKSKFRIMFYKDVVRYSDERNRIGVASSNGVMNMDSFHSGVK